MKRIFFAPLLLLMCLLPGSARTVAEKAAATYEGQIYIAVNEAITESTEPSASNVVLEAVTDNTVNVTLPNFKYGSLNLGDIVLNDIPVIENSDGKIVFGENAPQTVKLVGGTISANVSISSTTSFISEGNIHLDVNVSTRIVFSTMNINVRFLGTNPLYEDNGIVNEIVGDYSGWMYGDFNKQPDGDSFHQAAEMSITDAATNAVAISLPDITINSRALKNLNLTEVPVTKDAEGVIHFGTYSATFGATGSGTIGIDAGTSFIKDNKVTLNVKVLIGSTRQYNILFTTDLLPEVPHITGPAKDAEGTYSGNLYISLGEPVTGKTDVFKKDEISITATANEEITFAMKNFSFGESPLGDIILTGIPVSKDDEGRIHFGENEAQQVSLAGGAIVADVNIDPVASIIDGDSVAIFVNVVWDGNPIYVHFNTGLLPVEPDEPDPGTDPEGPAVEVAGTHPGNLYISLGNPVTSKTPVFKQDDITLEAEEGGNAVTLTLRNFSFGASPMGDIVLKNIPIYRSETVPAGAEKAYRFGKNDPQTVILASGTIIATVFVDSTTSTIIDDSLSIDIQVEWSNIPIFVHFDSGLIPEEPLEPAAQLAAGDYNGWLYISLGIPVTDQTAPFKMDKITLEAETDSTVSFTLRDFSFGESPMGDIVLKNIPVTNDNQAVVYFMPNDPQEVVLANGNITATAYIDSETSRIDTRRGNIDIDVVVEWSGFNIYVRFSNKDVSGITTPVIENADKAHGIFDLQGRRVQQMQKGLYIVNGRKVLVK